MGRGVHTNVKINTQEMIHLSVVSEDNLLFNLQWVYFQILRVGKVLCDA